MTKREKLLILLGVLTFALFNYPLLKIFNRYLSFCGIPLLIFYLFGVWLVTILILLVAKTWLSSGD